MRRQTPPLDAIEAFLAAIRQPNFRAAAAAMAVSPATFTRRIQALESFLGLRLFERGGRGPRLTERGAEYLEEIEPHLEAIRRLSLRIRRREDGAIRLATSPALASMWLWPRAPDLIRSGAIRLDLEAGDPEAALRNGDADVAIVLTEQESGSDNAEPLASLDGVPLIGSGALIDGRPTPVRLKDLRRHRLYAVSAPAGLAEAWMMGAQMDAAPEEIRRAQTPSLAYEAAAAGFGLTLGTPLLAGDYLSKGRLKPCIGVRASFGISYELRYDRSAYSRRSDVRHVTSWLHDQARKTEGAFWAAVHG